MERKKVENSQISSIGYDLENQKMEIEFSGGSVYRYDNIPHQLNLDLLAADSKGKFFAQHIKAFPDIFPFTKIRGTDREEDKRGDN